MNRHSVGWCAIGLLAASLITSASGHAAGAEADLLIADFEAPDYGNWTATGEAFGTGPAQGTLPDQMPVSGFEGHGLVNSYLHGDRTTGTLTSPQFKLERRYINFLVGGGSHLGETCLNLLVDGKAVRSTTGSESEHLDWETWDVGDLAGKTARIEIVDQQQGGWGHVNVDQIYQSAERRAPPAEVAALYHESLRPQFHFTAAKNWLNDPNGLVYFQGEYHLFFQHNPSGINWGNMTWGHAVSPDLLHWQQLDNALEPDKLGTIFSGSAVVDWHNTGGFKAGDDPALVCLYTSAGGTSPESSGQPFTQSLAYSNDCGRTWTKYAQNPVLQQVAGGNRDPKVIWHAGSKRWVMALFLDGERFALFGSPDLKQWQKLSDLPAVGGAECPDLFELPVVGVAPATSKWIFWAGNNNYLIGSFDGTTFVKESGPHRFEFGNNYYAAQSYSDIPAADGRRIQIGWMNGGKYPRMPFNQQMAFPSELLLEQTNAGLRVCRRPVKELDALHAAHHSWQGTLTTADNPLATIPGEQFDLRLRLEPGDAKQIALTIRGTALTYDVARQELSLLGKSVGLKPVAGQLELQVLVDRASIEVFADRGQTVLSSCFVPPAGDEGLALAGSGAQVLALDLWQIKSCWPSVAEAPQER